MKPSLCLNLQMLLLDNVVVVRRVHVGDPDDGSEAFPGGEEQRGHRQAGERGEVMIMMMMMMMMMIMMIMMMMMIILSMLHQYLLL